ncbi:MAG TPA: PHP domain-containing protein [Ktedonobacterales bacterium]|nr:PHP domain-containing protein [Ktedonobacterales bacterium]
MSAGNTRPAHIDLHTHSTASDGLFSPTELVRRASEAKLTLIGLTDHDTTNGVAEAQAAGASLGVTVIPGVEINTTITHSQSEAHVLGYYLDLDQPAFQATLAFLRDAREKRGERMVQQLRDEGISVEWSRVRELAKGTVGRPHVARALIEAGYATDVSDAFARYLTRGKAGYVPRFKLAPEQAIQLIRSAQGVPALAHPAGITGLAETVLPALVQAGLLGLECYYGEYDDETVARLLTLANQHDLIPTGGSDYHGPNIHPTPLGGRWVPPEAVEYLRQTSERLCAEPPTIFTLPEVSY